jgi:hypothetical protein
MGVGSVSAGVGCVGLVSDPTHLCRIGVGSVSAGVGCVGLVSDVSDWCRIQHICVGSVAIFQEEKRWN